MTDEAEIANLVYGYAERMDAGDFDGAARLFEHAEIVLTPDGATTTDAAGILELWRSMVIVHGDGTPRTKHVTTNLIVEIGGDTATCRSYYTVLQQVGDGPLSPIVAGRYHDSFERVDGNWRFSRRDLSMMDLVGDVSQHLRR
ncbi:MAG: nuclear transport factor 2 family protein [Acidimicrobiales bacterium]|nr:nuclear transport factor 2 family protein [Acidimicrobiales bacterium]